MRAFFIYTVLAGLATAFIACGGGKTKVESSGDSTTVATEEPVVIQNASIAGTEWSFGMAHNVIYSFKADQTCSIRSLLDTAAEEYRKASWKLSGDTLRIAESDTSLYKITEFTTVHLSIQSLNKPKETDEENYDQASDDYFSLAEGSDRRLLREEILYSKKQQNTLSAHLFIGIWDYKGYYSMADKSYEFNRDGTYTYIEGPRAEEKYISVKQKGIWTLLGNSIHLKRSADSGEVSDNLILKRITTSHLAFEGKKEVYLRFQAK